MGEEKHKIIDQMLQDLCKDESKFFNKFYKTDTLKILKCLIQQEFTIFVNY